MASMGDLGRDLKREAEDLKKRARNLLRRCAAGVLRNVVMGTPVGNKDIWLEPKKAPVGYVGGRARANWFVSLGTPSRAMADRIDASGGVSIGLGEAVIKTARHNSVIYIVNNLPYIIPLNNGHSHQAPSGFIETAVQSGMGQGLVGGLEDKS